MKIDTFDFEVKKRMMISINKSLIDGSMDEKNVNYFDKVFYKLSSETIELDIFLSNIWSEIKFQVRRYYNLNKELLNQILDYINLQLYSINKEMDINKVKVKVRGDIGE